MSASEDMLPTTIQKSKVKRPKTSNPGKKSIKLNFKRGISKSKAKKFRSS